jgi:hypothetical protein
MVYCLLAVVFLILGGNGRPIISAVDSHIKCTAFV